MKYSDYEIKEKNKNEIKTELMFAVASARVDGTDVLKLTFTHTGGEELDKKAINAATKLVKELKKNGTIDFYVTKDAFSRSTTESIYLINKFPELSNEIESSDIDTVFLRLKPFAKVK